MRSGTTPCQLLIRLLVTVATIATLAATAFAATELTVDGNHVPGLDQHTVAGVSYAPAEAFARALGAGLSRTDNAVSLRLGGRLLELRLSSDAVRTDAFGSVAIDGREVEGHAALDTGDGLMLPVKTVATAFGAVVTVLSGSRDEVEVRLPRARLVSLDRSTSGGSERLLLELSAWVPYTVWFNERLSTLQLQFARTDPAPLPEAIDGIRFEHAWLLTEGGRPELRIRLAEGAGYSLSATPAGNGYRLEVTFTAPPVAAPDHAQPGGDAARQAGGTVVLLHAGGAELTDLTLAVAILLRAEGVTVHLEAGSPADLQLYLERASGASVVQYLGDPASESALQEAIELAGGDAASVAKLRRELLLGVHGDPAPGREAATILQQELGLEQPAAGLPLTGLVPAGGKGVRLLLRNEDLGDPGLPGRLARGLLQSVVAR